MALLLDHVIVGVHNLQQAMNSYHALDFKVIEGGKHSAGTTHNALIVFEDGTYIELLAPTNQFVSSEVKRSDFVNFVNKDEGLSGFALGSDNLDTLADDLKSRGMKSYPIEEGMRTRPDGTQLRWRLLRLEDEPSIFFIQDVTDRQRRLSDNQSDYNHDNFVRGINGVNMIVSSLERGAEFFRGLIGRMPQIQGDQAVFKLENSTLVLMEAQDDAMRAQLGDRLFVPYSIVLKTKEDHQQRDFPLDETHGVRFQQSLQADLDAGG